MLLDGYLQDVDCHFAAMPISHVFELGDHPLAGVGVDGVLVGAPGQVVGKELCPFRHRVAILVEVAHAPQRSRA